MNVVVIQQKVIDFLISVTGQSSIDGATELQESEIIDSLTMMDLLVFIESEFGVRLNFEDITPEVFQTPATLAGLIESRANQPHGRK
jgi:acyl carrier protein